MENNGKMNYRNFCHFRCSRVFHKLWPPFPLHCKYVNLDGWGYEKTITNIYIYIYLYLYIYIYIYIYIYTFEITIHDGLKTDLPYFFWFIKTPKKSRKSADPGLSQGRGGARDHRRYGTCLSDWLLAALQRPAAAFKTHLGQGRRLPWPATGHLGWAVFCQALATTQATAFVF